MDWMKVVNAHVMWKSRLRNYLEGNSEEKLDPEVVCKDDQCPLGKWIYGEGKAYEASSLYATVRVDHASFHLRAAEIVRLVDAGDRPAAEKILTGDYARVSERLKHEIISLYQEINGPHS